MAFFRAAHGAQTEPLARGVLRPAIRAAGLCFGRMASGDFPGGGTPERSGGERSVRQGILRKNPCPPEGGSGHFPKNAIAAGVTDPSNARAVLRKHLASHGRKGDFARQMRFRGFPKMSEEKLPQGRFTGNRRRRNSLF